MKKMDKSKIIELNANLIIAQKEIDIQSKINHPNILRLYNSRELIDHYDLILEYASEGNLYQTIKKMKKYNVIVIFDKTEKKLLMCKRAKDPFKGKYNFVGGKVEQNETEDEAAYRELYEETGISKKDINITRVLDFKYYLMNMELEVYCGKINKDIILKEEINKL